ncbi:MAG: motility protein A [Planctomycetota bacterium]|nr:MAG: motility protein A [Planctomycetota bacterium]
MDLGTIIGLILGPLMVVVVGMGLDSVSMFWDGPSFAIVVGGAFASVLISMPLKTVLKIMIFFGIVVKEIGQPPNILIVQIVELAEKARRDGILALESAMDEVKEPFLKKGIELAVDGTDPELIAQILNEEIDTVDARHKDGINVMTLLNKYLPAWGMVGTLIGLVKMLANLDDPSTIGPSMAIALITTFYGSLFANLFCGPLADKLTKKNAEELMMRNIILQGVMSIQQGDNPRIVKQKLEVFLPPKDRVKD